MKIEKKSAVMLDSASQSPRRKNLGDDEPAVTVGRFWTFSAAKCTILGDFGYEARLDAAAS